MSDDHPNPLDLCDRSEKPHAVLAAECVYFFANRERGAILLSWQGGPGAVLGTGEGATPLPSGAFSTCWWDYSAAGPLEAASFPTPFVVQSKEQAKDLASFLRAVSGEPWTVECMTRKTLALRAWQWAEEQEAREPRTIQ